MEWLGNPSYRDQLESVMWLVAIRIWMENRKSKMVTSLSITFLQNNQLSSGFPLQIHVLATPELIFLRNIKKRFMPSIGVLEFIIAFDLKPITVQLRNCSFISVSQLPLTDEPIAALTARLYHDRWSKIGNPDLYRVYYDGESGRKYSKPLQVLSPCGK